MAVFQAEVLRKTKIVWEFAQARLKRKKNPKQYVKRQIAVIKNNPVLIKKGKWLVADGAYCQQVASLSYPIVMLYRTIAIGSHEIEFDEVGQAIELTKFVKRYAVMYEQIASVYM